MQNKLFAFFFRNERFSLVFATISSRSATRPAMSRAATYCGCVLIVLAGFSATFKDEDDLDPTTMGKTLAEAGTDASRFPPFDVAVALGLGLLLIIWGSVESLPAFKSISGIKALTAVTRDEFLERPSFRRYDTRASVVQARLSGKGEERAKIS
jgi:hypothetical protein